MYVYGAPISNIETLQEDHDNRKSIRELDPVYWNSPEHQQCDIDSEVSLIRSETDIDLNDSIQSVFTDFIPVKTPMEINHEI